MYRARSTLRRLINANAYQLTKFITLTFSENVKDVRVANNCFTGFIKRLKYYLKKNNSADLKYIAVIEFMKNGRVHYHMLSNIPYIENSKLRKIWGNGYVKINKMDKVDNVGAYVCKYMSKQEVGDSRLKGEKSYFTSRNLDKPVEIHDTEEIKRLLGQEGVMEKLVFSSEFQNEYLGKVEYRQFNFNRTV